MCVTATVHPRFAGYEPVAVSVFRFDTTVQAHDEATISRIAWFLGPFHLTPNVRVIGVEAVKTDHCAGSATSDVHNDGNSVLHAQTSGEHDIVAFEFYLELGRDLGTLRGERAGGLLAIHRRRMAKLLETIRPERPNHDPHIVEWQEWGSNGQDSAPATFIFTGTELYDYLISREIVIHGRHIFIATYDHENRPIFGDFITFSTNPVLVDTTPSMPIPQALREPDVGSTNAALFAIVLDGKYFRRRFLDLTALRLFVAASASKIRWIAPSAGRLFVLSTKNVGSLFKFVFLHH